MSTESRRLRVVPPPTVEPVSDAVLVARGAAGDAAALETIFRRHAPLVLHLCIRLLRDRSDAEDVLQETFEKVLKSLGSLREPDALKAWVVQIAVRQVRMRYRKRRMLRAFGFVSARSETVTLEALASPELSHEHRAELALLDHALQRLPLEVRLAWMLRHVEGLELDAVAKACGCSLATAKRRIAHADDTVRRRAKLAPGEDS